MRKQSVLLWIILLILLTLPGQTTLSRLWASEDDSQSIHAAAQTGSPVRQPGSTFLTGPTPGDPLDIAIRYLHQQAAALGLSATDLADLTVTDRYITQHNGVTHLYLRQRYHGIEVFNGVITIHISRNGEVISLGNRFVPNLAQAVNTETPSLTAIAAVEYAAQQLKLNMTAPVSVVEDRDGPARELRLSSGGFAKATIPAKLVYQRQGDGKVRLAWSLLIEPLAEPHRWQLRIDAVDGTLLAQDDWILYDQWAPPRAVTMPSVTMSSVQPPTMAITSAVEQSASPLTPPTYRVFPLPLEHPNDGPGLPDAQTLLDTPADELASPYGWHDIDGAPGHEFNDTRGNNVSAQEDRNGDDSDGFRPTGLKPRKFNFDYPFDPLLEPTADTNTAAAIVNLFYWNNILHDITYRYGFDEASGNFQENNYGRGGLGSDAVQADVQDSYDWGARNNAYFVTTPDGEHAYLGMYVFDYTTPNRDSAFDNGIIAHEYAHGISTRLVGGPSNPSCLYNGEQMGEGWSDWFALALTTKPNDTGREPRGLGAYALGQPPDSPGFRRYPYSTVMTIDPFTYADLRRTSGDIYLIGQVWSSMLWELQWNLIEQYGFDPNLYTGAGGNNLALRLVIDGMKLTPCEPGFVDARDAILTADQMNNGGANACSIWRAFAKRGLGVGAQQGSPYDFSDGIAAFTIPTVCRDDLSLTKYGTPDPVTAGKVLTYELVASNYTGQAVTGVLLTDPIPAHTTYVDGSASDGGGVAGGVVTWQLPTLQPDESVTRTFRVNVDRDFPDAVTIFADDMESGGNNWSATGLWHLQSDAESCGNSFSPTHSWYYGVTPGCSYTDNSSGDITLVNPIALPLGDVTLKFMSWEAYETCCDLPEALISTDGINFHRVWNANASHTQWHEVAVDLSDYAGQSIWLRFAFHSDGSITYTGWYVDDVRLIVTESIVNSATLTTNEGVTATATSSIGVVKRPELALAPTAFDERLIGGTTLTRTLSITNVGTAPLTFSFIEVAQEVEAQTRDLTPAATIPQQSTTSAAVSYAGDQRVAHPQQAITPQTGGLTGTTNPNVLLLAAANAYQLQAMLAAYPDLGQVDFYDARDSTPMLEELLPYATVIVIANNAFADSEGVGDLLADYVDSGGTVIQASPTFYDPYGSGWGLRGRFIIDGYSPFLGVGDWLLFAELGNVDATHPIMQGVTYAGDSLRQVVELTSGAQWVASWSDDEFVATKGSVVALNTFLADGYAWVGDIPLIVHNSIIWLQSKGGGDVPWLAVTPMTSTLAVGESQSVELTFDARPAAIEQAGDYAATLRILSNDPQKPTLDVPLTMHVLGPEVRIAPASSYFGREVTIPVNFTSHENAVAATAFSVDFDESCLYFDPADADGNGIPDAIKLMTPSGFELVARANISDVNSEIALFIGDLTPPLTALPDGALVTIDLNVRCQPQATPLPVRVGFGATPPASFSDLNGVTLLGLLVEGAVEVQPGLSGDCNQDGLVNASDAIACVLELFDGDGSFWLDAPGGAFVGSPQGCDSNLDEQIDAGDILCTVLTIFQGQGVCHSAIDASSSGAPAALAIPEGLMAQPGGTVTVPVYFSGNGNAIGAAVFALTFDPAALTLDQSDGDSNGIPDAITFNLPEGVMTSVQVVDNRRIQIAMADLSLPFVTLPDGVLVNITFTAGAQAQESDLTFAGDLRASVGTHTGQSAAVTTDDGSVLIAVAKTTEAWPEKAYLPWIER